LFGSGDYSSRKDLSLHKNGMCWKRRRVVMES
jgi:hypothetical protein